MSSAVAPRPSNTRITLTASSLSTLSQIQALPPNATTDEDAIASAPSTLRYACVHQRAG